MKSFLQYLEEAYISPNNGAKYGQVIFLVGGAASGKSTAIRNFIDSASYKTLNPDDIIGKCSRSLTVAFECYIHIGEDIHNVYVLWFVTVSYKTLRYFFNFTCKTKRAVEKQIRIRFR